MMPRARTASVSDLDIRIDDEGVARIVNVPGESLVLLSINTLSSLLTETVAHAMSRGREPLE